MVSHEDMLLEHGIYYKLVQIRVFKQFRLWKMFYVWRRTIKRDKYERTVRCFLFIFFYFFAHGASSYLQVRNELSMV